MKNLENLVFALSLLLLLHAARSDPLKSKFQRCNPKESSQEKTGCPKNSTCIDNGTAESFCVCSSELTVNDDYKIEDKTSRYCVKKIEITSTTLTPLISTKTPASKTNSPINIPSTIAETSTIEPSTKVPQTTKLPFSSTVKATTSTKAPDDVKVAPAPEPAHLLSGVLIPIILVLGFVCGVFAIKKYNLIERTHGYIRNRSQHQRYNGLMENEFDDDDPLLI